MQFVCHACRLRCDSVWYFGLHLKVAGSGWHTNEIKGCGAERFSAPYLLLSVLGTRNPGRTERIHFQCLNDFVPACDLQRAATRAKCVGHAQPVHQATPIYSYWSKDASPSMHYFLCNETHSNGKRPLRVAVSSNLMAITGLLKGLAAGAGAPSAQSGPLWVSNLARSASPGRVVLVHWATSFASSTYPHILPAFP